MRLTKQQAIGIFDGNGAALGRALGLSRARISQWPPVLEQRETDLVVGAAVRLGKSLPEEFNPIDINEAQAVA